MSEESKSLSSNEWAALFVEQSSSGESITSFCAKRGVNPNSFYWQRKKLSDKGGSGFVRAEVKATQREFPGLYEVSVPNGRTLRVDEHFDPEVLSRLLKALEGQ